MKGFLAKLCKNNGIAKRIVSMSLALMMVLSTLQVLPAGILTANAAETDVSLKLHFYNEDGWTNPGFYYWGGTTEISGNNGNPETIWTDQTVYPMTEEENGWYSITAVGEYTGFLFVDIADTDKKSQPANQTAISQFKGQATQDLYCRKNSSGEWRLFTDSEGTTELTSTEPETNITINLGIPTDWGWTKPAMQYWGCNTVTLLGCGEKVPITVWQNAEGYIPDGYPLTHKQTDDEKKISWYTITIKGDWTGFGGQFLDLDDPNGHNSGNLTIANELFGDTYKGENATNVYITCNDSAWKWYKDAEFTTYLDGSSASTSGGGNSSTTDTNITINLGIPADWGWTKPAMQYWGCNTVTLSGCGEKVPITVWQNPEGYIPDGYPLTHKETDAEKKISWYTITIKGDWTGFGGQFLDLDDPNGHNSGNLTIANELFSDTYKGENATNVYITCNDNGWKWYKDAEFTTYLDGSSASTSGGSTFTQQTITMHFQKPVADTWPGVSAYLAQGTNWDIIENYGYAKNWPGAKVEENLENPGWYSFKITMPAGQFNCQFTNGKKDPENKKTDNIVFVPTEENTEKWVTLQSVEGTAYDMTDSEPTGWITNTQTINPPVAPTYSYSSPLVNADGTITFNYSADGTTAVEIMGTEVGSSWTKGSGFDMVEQGGIFTYTTVNKFTPGKYQYKYIVNGTDWLIDPVCGLGIGEGANRNSVVVVPGLVNATLAPEKGVPTALPKLDFYTAGSIESTKPAVNYTLDDQSLKDLVKVDNGMITVDKACTATEFTLTASYNTYTSKVTITPQNEVYKYTIYYYDHNEEHMATDVADVHMWSKDGGLVNTPAKFSTVETLTDGRGWLKTVVETPSTHFGFLVRNGEDYKWQTSDYVYSNTGKIKEVTLYVVNGDGELYTSLPELVDPRDRYIMVAYDREDGQYEDTTKGWNFYSWNTGITSETEIYGKMLNDEYVMVAPIRDTSKDFTLGFIVRNSEKASNGEKWLEKDGGDVYITIPSDQEVVKVYFEQGKSVVRTLPYNKSYEIDSTTSTITFYYRDDAALVANNTAQLTEKVQVVVDGTAYDMAYDADNERYYYALTGCTEKDYAFSYKVGNTDVADKFASNGVVTYKSFDDLGITATLSQASMDYNDNNVLTVAFSGADAANITKAEVESITADLSQLGLSSEFAIAPELMEGTIAVSRDTSLGEKTISVTLKDVYGNKYTTSIKVNVVERDADAFDWDEAVIYMTCTDRFFDGNTSNNTGVDKDYSLGYHGGDFAGLTAKLDYLQNLGVNTIWITPIVQNSNTDEDNGYHGYWASDFTKLSSYLGTPEEFNALLDAAHNRDMKIMVDVVLNHAGYGTEEYFNSVIPNTKMIRDGKNTVVKDDIYDSLAGLPDFMTEDEAVRNQLIKWQVDWIEKYDIDYYRVDTVKHVQNITWQAFKNELTKVNPDFKMIGEYAGAGYASTGGTLGTGMMDSLLDFDINDKAISFVLGDITSVEEFYTNRNGSINNTAVLGGFLSSHDEDSFVDKLIQNGKTEAEALTLAKVAAALQITAKGQIVIYSGEEIGQHGLENWPAQTNRKDFNWAAADAQNGVEGSMLTHYQKLLSIRNKYSDLLSMGTRTKIVADNAAGYDVFKRATTDEALFVALNIKDAAQSVSFSTGAKDGTVYTDLYSGKTYTVASGKVTVSIPAAVNGGTVILVEKVEETPDTPSTPGDSGEGSSPSEPEDSDDDSASSAPEEPKAPAKPAAPNKPATQNRPATPGVEEDEIEVEVETQAETKVPEKVKDFTPIVDKKLQNAIANEAEKILKDIINDEISEDVMSKETIANVKEAQKNGKDIITEIIVDKLDESKVEADVKEALEKALEESVKDKKGAETKIAQYLDLSILLKTAEGKELGKINKLSKNATFTIAIPAELVKEGRAFVVLRMHEGETTVLETSMNSDGTLSFKTDRFSTYALAYVDEPAEDAKEDETTEGDIPSGSTTTEEEGNSNFATFIIVGLIIVIIAAVVVIFLTMKRKKEE